MNSKGKKEREGETPALKNPIFVDNILQSGLKNNKSLFSGSDGFKFKCTGYPKNKVSWIWTTLGTSAILL